MKKESFRLANIVEKQAVEIKVEHCGEDLFSKWIITYEGDNKNKLKIQCIKFKIDYEVSRIRVNEYSQTEYLLNNKTEISLEVGKEEIDDILDAIRGEYLEEPYFEYNASYRLFTESVNIEWYNGKDVFKEEYYGDSFVLKKCEGYSFFDFFSKLNGDLPFYHQSPVAMEIQLKMRGIIPWIKCFIPMSEFNYLYDTIMNYEEAVPYVLPTLNNRLYVINTGEIQSFQYDTLHRTIRKYMNGLLWIPEDYRILHKNEIRFYDNTFDEECLMEGGCNREDNWRLLNQINSKLDGFDVDEKKYHLSVCGWGDDAMSGASKLIINLTNATFFCTYLTYFGDYVYNLLPYHYHRWDNLESKWYYNSKGKLFDSKGDTITWEKVAEIEKNQIKEFYD